ncbi:glutamic acid-rich protein-like [Ptychodera flava]|uniref:glutamic acid-rich protein-like n=1 Tax=Ptychodera flava TaxID=63121 RepID=UPI003969D1E4
MVTRKLKGDTQCNTRITTRCVVVYKDTFAQMEQTMIHTAIYGGEFASEADMDERKTDRDDDIPKPESQNATDETEEGEDSQPANMDERKTDRDDDITKPESHDATDETEEGEDSQPAAENIFEDNDGDIAAEDTGKDKDDNDGQDGSRMKQKKKKTKAKKALKKRPCMFKGGSATGRKQCEK